MLDEKNVNHEHKMSAFVVCLFLPLLLTSCSTTHISGLDQIFFPNSSARVGPLVTADEQYPLNNRELVDIKRESTAPPAIDYSEAENKVGTTQVPNTELQTVIQVSNPKPLSEPAINTTAVKVAKKKALTPLEKNTQKRASNAIPKEQHKSQAKTEHGAVTGQVVLIAEDGQALTAQGTLITLTPKKSHGDDQNSQPKRHVIDMQDKQYQTRYSTINTGDEVVFVNKDNIQHNVFSSSGSNAFDLGTYGAGLKRGVTLTEPGIVKVYCNIHADMATFVAVADPGLSVEVDDQGRYQMDKVPLGTYDMTVWNIRGETTRTIEIKAKETLELVDRIDTAVVKKETHKNKFGGNYSKNAALFEDEFY